MSVVAAAVGGLLASAGALGTSVTPAVAAPTVPDAARLDTVPVAKGATAKVTAPNPVAESRTLIAADFAKADTYPGRWVSVQYENTTGAWVTLGVPAKLDKSGKVQFGTTKPATLTYRVVALAGKGKKLASTPEVTATRVWKRVLNEDFKTDFRNDPDSLWSTRMDGRYVGSRRCSAPNPANSVVYTSAQVLSLKFKKLSTAAAKERQAVVAKQKRDAAIKKATTALDKAEAMKKGSKRTKALKSAKAALAKARAMSTTKGCPYGVFSNAMISTEGKFTLRSGIVAAKVKFPKAKGIHSAVWLQSASGQEIDFIESFGFGKGITNYIHVPAGDELRKIGGYVAKSTAKKSSWWKKAHVFSVQWDKSQAVFRVDGKVTKTIGKNLTTRDYFVVLSLLSSDWELPLLKGTSSAAMEVDWVRAWTSSSLPVA